MEKVLSAEPGTPQGCSPLLHLLSPFPTVGQRDYSSPRGEPNSQQEPQSPAGRLYEKESSLQNPSLGLTRVSLIEIMSHF